MRFDEYTEKHGLAVSSVERFAGLVVEVGAVHKRAAVAGPASDDHHRNAPATTMRDRH